ncbi:preprotein translocase subunit SecE [bacterium]|jgi:preprotein translocase SecE subunit|nr:preprotein translocase subunit SecE [bacterium]
MENQHQKWVNLSYLAVAILFGYLVFSLTGKLVGAYDLETRIRSIDLMMRIGSVVAGALLFIGLYRNEKANQFMNEVVVELSRVAWPTQKETSSATMIVIVMVVVSGMVLGLLDYFWVQILKWIL